MATIEIDDEVFAKLQAEAIPLVDTPNSVLRRLLDLEQGKGGQLEAMAADQPVSRAPREGRGRKPATQQGSRSRRTRRSAGELLPIEAYGPAILRVLRGRGGEAHLSEVTEEVGQLLQEQFTSADREAADDGSPSWTKRVGWAASACRKRGHLDSNAPRGLWRLTEAGVQAADSEGEI